MREMRNIVCAVLLMGIFSTTPLSAQMLPQRPSTTSAFDVWSGFDFRTESPDKFQQHLTQSLLLTPKLVNDSLRRAFLSMVVDSASVNDSFVEPTLSAMKGFYNHPNSPYRDDASYIFVLDRIIENPAIDDIHKLSPRIVVEQLRKNSVGQKATDFQFESLEGESGSLSKIEAEYTILFFVDPDCEECSYTKSIFSKSPIITRNSSVKILAIYPDADFDLWRKSEHITTNQWINARDPEQTINNQQLYHLTALPTLYLLDADKRVVLKDVYVEDILEYLSNK